MRSAHAPPRTPTVAARIAAFVLGAAAARGADAEALAAEAGVDPALAADPDARIPLATELRLWSLAAERCGDADFGLHAAQALRPGAFDVLDYAVRTAPTLRAALQRLARYNRLMHDVADFALADDAAAGTTTLCHGFAGGVPGPNRQAAEFTLGSIVAIGAQLAARPLRPRAVSFVHAAPASVAAHLALFGVAPVFGAADNRLVFDSAVLDVPVQGAEPALSRIVTAQAEQALAALGAVAQAGGGNPGLAVDALRQWLAEALPAGEATLATAARALCLSERSLQRRLAEAGSSFAAELDAVRHALALRHVAERRLAFGEIAFLLGFSEPSAFHRAFRRWTGRTPSALRAAC